MEWHAVALGGPQWLPDLLRRHTRVTSSEQKGASGWGPQ